MNDTAILRTEHLAIGFRKSRGNPGVLADQLCLELRRGELVCLLGRNGVGKSTLLRTLAGLQFPLAGKVEIGGVDLGALTPRELAKKRSVVLTERLEVGNLSVFELVSLGRHPHTGWSGQLSTVDEEAILSAMELSGVAELAGRLVGELSDGESQKALIARSLAQDAELVILDEPTAFLDLPHRIEILNTLRRLARNGRGVLLSTHDLDLALGAADRVWLMDKAGVMTTGAPEELILSGAFQQAFEQGGVRFDTSAGVFRFEERPTRDIVLRGVGDGAYWTARALRRIGFRVLAEPSSQALESSVEQVDDHLLWRLRQADDWREFSNLGEFLAALTD